MESSPDRHKGTFSSRRRRVQFLILAFLLLPLAVGLPILAGRWRPGGWNQPLRVIVLDDGPGALEGLAPDEGSAVLTLLQDCMAVASQAAVSESGGLRPEGMGELIRTSPVLLRLGERRRGDLLSLEVSVARGASFGDNPRGVWQTAASPFLPPRQAFAWLMARVPGLGAKRPPAGILPGRDDRFWTLVRSMAWDGSPEAEERTMALDLARRIVEEDPGCASAWIQLGKMGYQDLSDNSRAGATDQNQTEYFLWEALRCVPFHPRGATLLVGVLTAAGDHRAALDLLAQATRLHPNAPELWNSMAYAARAAGLLEGSLRALDCRDGLWVRGTHPLQITNTYLYLGDLARFEKGLWTDQGQGASTVLEFYRGYVALLRGNPVFALSHFRAAEAHAPRNSHFGTLAGIYADILAGQTEKARGRLDAMARDRLGLGMRAPDGEFTFKMAEAYALLGDSSRAVDVASHAFAQGFGCLRWYRQCPLLAGARELPRWKALEQHLQEREALYLKRYPLAVFGPGQAAES